MAATTETIQISGLSRGKLASLRKQAKTLGMSAEAYATHLVEEGIALDRLARTKTFDDLYGTTQARFRKSGMSEDGLDQLVARARSRHARTSRKKG